MQVKDYLREIDKLDRMITNRLDDARMWKDKALSISVATDSERVQSSGIVHDRMADAVARMADIEIEIESLSTERSKMIDTIERLKNPIEYDVIYQHYVKKLTLQECADVLNISYRTLTSVHGNALRHLQEIIDGFCKL